jgi:cell division ATPase FtsA
MLAGMCDMAERILNCQARNGLATGIDRWPKELDNPAWTTAAGLTMYSGRLKMKRDWKRTPAGLAGLALR